MKIVIMGAGALGSISAALLHAAGHDVTLVAQGGAGRATERKGRKR